MRFAKPAAKLRCSSLKTCLLIRYWHNCCFLPSSGHQWATGPVDQWRLPLRDTSPPLVLNPVQDALGRRKPLHRLVVCPVSIVHDSGSLFGRQSSLLTDTHYYCFTLFHVYPSLVTDPAMYLLHDPLSRRSSFSRRSSIPFPCIPAAMLPLSLVYEGAWMQEPAPWANLTLHDSVIFRDNDFEIFINANGDNHK